jgi:hypothetical protein
MVNVVSSMPINTRRGHEKPIISVCKLPRTTQTTTEGDLVWLLMWRLVVAREKLNRIYETIVESIQSSRVCINVRSKVQIIWIVESLMDRLARSYLIMNLQAIIFPSTSEQETRCCIPVSTSFCDEVRTDDDLYIYRTEMYSILWYREPFELKYYIHHDMLVNLLLQCMCLIRRRYDIDSRSFLMGLWEMDRRLFHEVESRASSFLISVTFIGCKCRNQPFCLRNNTLGRGVYHKLGIFSCLWWWSNSSITVREELEK